MGNTTTGERIGDVLDSIDFTEPEKRNLDTGDAIFDVAATGERTSLQLIQDMLTAERGVVYVQRDGVFRYEERATRARKTTAAGTITNAVVRTDPGWELDSLKNRVTVQRISPATGNNTGRAQVAENTASVAAYGVSDAEQITTGYLSPQTDATALSLAQYIVNIRQGFRKPVDVELHANDEATSVIQLARELQDRITLDTDTAAGDWHIEKITHRIRPGSFITSFSLSDRGTEAFVIDTDTFDNTTNLITY